MIKLHIELINLKMVHCLAKASSTRYNRKMCNNIISLKIDKYALHTKTVRQNQTNTTQLYGYTRKLCY